MGSSKFWISQICEKKLKKSYFKFILPQFIWNGKLRKIVLNYSGLFVNLVRNDRWNLQILRAYIHNYPLENQSRLNQGERKRKHHSYHTIHATPLLVFDKLTFLYFSVTQCTLKCISLDLSQMLLASFKTDAWRSLSLIYVCIIRT